MDVRKSNAKLTPLVLALRGIWGRLRMRKEMKNKSTPLVIEDDAPDIVYAGDGEDRVTGGRGDDFIDGGTGNDVEWRLAA